jgi:hypothetical protein
MNKPTTIQKQPTDIFQWTLNGDECGIVRVPLGGKVLVQVEGDLAGEVLTIYGGIDNANVPLDVVRSTPALVVLPPVRCVKPVGPAGITVTVMGAA